jgi:translocation and assembly module TamB
LNALPQPPFSNYENPRRPEPAPVSRRTKVRWKRILLWIGAGLVTLVLIVVVGIAILLRSDRARAYLLRTAQQKATEALGSQIQMRDFTFHWSGWGPSVELYDVVIHGAAPYENPPLLQADSLRVQVTITSFLHWSWYVNDISIAHPVVRVFADNQGHTNIPAPKSSNKQSNTNIFDLGIRHLLLEHGEAYYNNQKSKLSADLRELDFRSGYELAQKKYSGTLSYRDGHVLLENANPIIHSLDARFSATAEKADLESAVLKTRNSRISLTASMTDYSQPKVHATYEAIVDGSEFRADLKNPALPAGVIQLSGVVDYANDPDRSPLVTTNVNGTIRSTVLTVANQEKQVQIRNMGAQYALSSGNAEVSQIHAEILGGVVSGTATMHDLTGATKSHLMASIRGLSMEALQALAGPDTASRATVHGTLDVNADASWGKTLDNLIARADASLQGNLQPPQGGTAASFNGVIHTRYNAQMGQMAFDQSYVRAQQTSVTLTGTVSKNSALQVRLESGELHELESLAAAFRPADSSPMGLYGRATLTANVTGSMQSPQIDGQFDATNFRVHGSSWKLLRANLAANPSSVRVENGQLDAANEGSIGFRAAANLQKWEFTKSSRFDLRVTAAQLRAGDLTKAAGLTTPITGILTVDVTANGTELAPTGHGSIRLDHARVAEEPIKSANINLDGTGTQVNATLNIDLTAGSATAKVSYDPRQQAYRAELRALNIKLEQLETVKARNLQLTGVLNVSADGRGTMNDPQLESLVEIPELKIRDEFIKGLKLQTTVKNHAASFNLDSQLLQTQAQAHGTIQLTGDDPAEIAFDTKAIPLQPLFAVYAPSQAANLNGQTEVHATLHGPLKDKTRLEAHLQIPQLALNYKNTIQIAAAGPIRADFVNGALDVQKSIIRGTGTEITLQANIPTAKDAKASMLVRGNIDLQLAQLLSPDITSGGQIQFDIDSFGPRSAQNVQGQVRIVNASFASAGLPVGLQGGNGVLTLTRDRLDVTQFQGKVGGGNVTASGGVVYRPSLRFDLAMAATGVRVLYAQSMRTTIGSNLAFTGTYDDALLRGQVRIEQLSFAPDFDLTEFAGQLGGEETPPPTQGFTQNLRLAVEIQTPGGLNLSSRTLSLAGSANLRVQGTAAQPVILGRMNLSGGDLIFSGNRYIVQGGTIDFRNPARTEPVVDMSVNTTIQQYDIQMRFWGPADHLHTNYASDPALPPSDIINLIAFGKTSEAAAANPTPPGSLGAQSLIASQVSGQVTNRIEKLAGISQLSVDPVLGGGQQNPGARIAIQQRVTSKIFVTFSTDVTSTQSQIIKLEYQKNRRTSFSGVRDQNGGLSFQTNFRKEW